MYIRRKKLLIITNRFYPQIGGAERNIFLQSKALSQYFDVEVMTPFRDKGVRVEKEQGLQFYRYYNLYNPLNAIPYKKSKTFCPEILISLLLKKYDLIHCFPAINPNNIMALLVARFLRIPIFLTNFDLFNYSELLLQQKASLEELTHLSLSRKQRYFLPKFNSIFTIAEKETKMIKQVNPNTFLSIVPVDIEEYDQDLSQEIQKFREKFRLSDTIPIILCLSRIAYIKGQDIFLQGISLLDKNQKFVAVIAGRTDYEPEYFQSLKTFVKEKQLENKVIFTDVLRRKEVLAAIQCCSFHVLPMRFMNSGAVVIETWALGKPVLQSNQIDPNYVVEGENGFTFSIENTLEFSNKIRYLLQNEQDRNRMGKNGKKFVYEKFSYSYLIQQYKDAYLKYGLDVFV